MIVVYEKTLDAAVATIPNPANGAVGRTKRIRNESDLELVASSKFLKVIKYFAAMTEQ